MRETFPAPIWSLQKIK